MEITICESTGPPKPLHSEHSLILPHDPLDQENTRFSREKPHVFQSGNAVVVIPSPNKWNCFSIRDRTKLATVCTNIKSSELNKLGIMNTTSISPTASLEIDNVFTIDQKSKGDPAVDYQTQVGRTCENDRSRSESGYRRLTLREKLAKRRADRDAQNKPETPDSTAGDKPEIPDSCSDASPVQTGTGTRLTKAASFNAGPGSSTCHHAPASRSYSVNAVTEEKTLFGFKVLRGAAMRPSGDAGKKDERKSNSFTRAGSLRLPRQNGNVSRVRRSTEIGLFYTPKAGTSAISGGDSTEKATEKSELTRSNSWRRSGKNRIFTDLNSNIAVKRDGNDTNDKNGGNLRLSEKPAVLDDKKEMEKDSNRMDDVNLEDEKLDEKVRSSKKQDEISDEGSKETSSRRTSRARDDVDEEDKTGDDKARTSKLIIRAESLQEGRSRLPEFREKQRRGKLSRSFTSPESEADEISASAKGKNISESLAEIRERIRERRRKKEQLKRSRSLPETESTPLEQVDVKESSLGSSGVKHTLTKEKGEVRKDKDAVPLNATSAKKERSTLKEEVEQKEQEMKKSSEKGEGVSGGDVGLPSEKPEERRAEENVKTSSEKQKKPGGLRLISSFKSESKPESSLRTEKDTEDTSSDQSKHEIKKPTKRERRRQERYQRSKTMSAIMYSDIYSSATRESQHKDDGAGSQQNGEPVTVPTVSEIKRKFMETEGGRAKSELGLFYSSKSSSPKPDSQKVKAKDSQKSMTMDSKNITGEKDEARLVNNSDKTGSRYRGKTSIPRRHTLAMGSEKTILDNEQDSLSAVRKEELSLVGTALPRRRHTFSEDSSVSRSQPSPLKPSLSVEKLKEKFSQCDAAVFPNQWTSSSQDSSVKTSDSGCKASKISDNEIGRRRIKSDEGSSKMRAEIYVNANAANGSSLTRRHTIGSRPTKAEPHNYENIKKERRKFCEKFSAKNDEIIKEEHANISKATASEKKGRSSPASEKDEGLKSRVSKRDEGKVAVSKKQPDDKSSVSKLRKLFLGKPASPEKKTKLRERRARTIAGSLSPEIVKELESNSPATSPASQEDGGKSFVESDHYVDDVAHEEGKKKETENVQSSRKAVGSPKRVLSRQESDPIPNDYLSNEHEEGPQGIAVSCPGETKSDSGFRERDRSDDKPQSNSKSTDFSEEDIPVTDGKIEVTDYSAEPKETKDSSVSVKDQCLDEYLTTIKTLAESPKSQRYSSRRSPLKGKLNGAQAITRDLNGSEGDDLHRSNHLDVAKANLSLHSWSTSDLDKIFYQGEGKNVSNSGSQMEISSMDFDEISSSTTRLQSLTEGRTKARPKRSSSKSLNPMKSLMERTDLRTNTEEPVEEETSKSGFEKPKKRSTPRKKRAQLEPWRRHTLDPVALAALASREDFSRVSLRKTKGPGKEKDEYGGSLPVMLIQIKGRKQVQTRLVEPKQSSLNSGDCFILVTPKELFCWIGNNANTIEKAKAVEISSKIQKRGDLNCKTGDVLYIDEAKQGNSLAYKKFCKILGGDTSNPIEGPKLCPDDEFYEREVISTNKVYKLQEGDPPHLIPVTEECGHMPRIGILNTKEVFVFDFGSELYLWTGQQSLSGKRKVAFHLAQMLYKQQFKYDTVVSPIEPRRTLKRSQSSSRVYHDAEGKECGRPTWTLFGKLHEKAETLLFQEKFFDWPDPTKIIKMKGHVSSGELPVRPPPIELKACDPTEMQKPAAELEPVILECTNLGRGLGTPSLEVDGVLREGNAVTTLGMTVWLVTQNKHFVLPKKSEGHFHSGDGYVIRWVYFVAKNRLVKDKRGRTRAPTGRQRCAYFFWQGNECTVNEKGAAAIMAVELDEERGPQIRVVEGKEPPHFLKLFDGAMVIHSGKRIRLADDRDDFSDKSKVRMYCMRNEDTSEGCLVQVRRSSSSLRSRTSFVVVDSEVGNIFVWHGCKASEYHRKAAEKAANYINDRRPIEVNLSDEKTVVITEFEEGRESESFWRTVGGKKHGYISLLKDPLNCDFSPRLFNLTSATGQFTATEIYCPSRYPGRTCPFPVLQEDLYSSCQPAMFILDAGDEVYVWEGWLPAEITKDKKGSAKRRWDEERKLALQTALSYVNAAKKRIKKGAYVVQAGLEPLSFITHFPFWDRRQSITEIKIKEGKHDCEKKPVKDVLDTFTQKYYSFQELTGDNPPDGIDLSKLETYLKDDEFEKIFEMPRDLFDRLPGWKQDILKKAFGLF